MFRRVTSDRHVSLNNCGGQETLHFLWQKKKNATHIPNRGRFDAVLTSASSTLESVLDVFEGCPSFQLWHFSEQDDDDSPMCILLTQNFRKIFRSCHVKVRRDVQTCNVHRGSLYKWCPRWTFWRKKRHGCIIKKRKCDEDEISSTEFAGISCKSIVGEKVEMMMTETQKDANYCR